MLASMYSSISGMKNHQQQLDVTSNNIANVNTYGYKKGRATFKDMISQQIQGATAPNDTSGGVNPMQVGLGTQMGSIDTVHTQGSLQNTGRSLDLGISGDGFFTVGEHTGDWEGNNVAGAVDDDGNGYGNLNTSYTRAGNFYLDEQGHIVNQDGQYLIGNTTNSDNGEASVGDLPNVEGDTTLDDNNGDPGRIQIPADAESFSIGADGSVSFVSADGNQRVAGQVQMARFENPGGLSKAGSNLFQPTDNSGEAQYNNPGDGAGELVPGTLEMSNVDLSEEFTNMITAQRGFQANTRGITTADEVLQELMNLKR
ncbi:flagellar basal body rod protein FlgG [Salibacterium qingdaonense]|uniref:Flagellar hook protein FlgE n=1 Tax=Salibacterium qingdaonense TaxID=266892 RepID=A0A1I4PPV4_9BACI|nr:flagellar basal body rod protein FlgG [Salibacterium qingdaonense]SFM29931.1 flagellar hook protein FlgE [Salibacterium qingdaonense]